MKKNSVKKIKLDYRKLWVDEQEHIWSDRINGIFRGKEIGK